MRLHNLSLHSRIIFSPRTTSLISKAYLALVPGKGDGKFGGIWAQTLFHAIKMSDLIRFIEHIVSTAKLHVIELVQYGRFLVCLAKVPSAHWLTGLALEGRGWPLFSTAWPMVNLNSVNFHKDRYLHHRQNGPDSHYTFAWVQVVSF